MNRLPAVVAVVAILLAQAPPSLSAVDYPQEWMHFEASGIVNMRTDGGAVGDGKTDDTAAFRAVFQAGKQEPHPRFGSARVIYLPPGTYLLSGEVVWGDKKKFIIGSGVDRTVIRLADRAAGFGDPDKPRAFLDTRGKQHFAQNFNQRLGDLTIEIGAGNPGCIALEYHTNNMGSIRDLAIRSTDPAGAGFAGLGLTQGPGPGLVWNLSVEGFDYGVYSTSHLHSMTIGRLDLRDQRKAGISTTKQSLFLSHVISDNRVPLLHQEGGLVTMVEVQARGGAKDATAIVVEKGLLGLRSVTVEGYGTSLAHQGGELDERRIDQWFTARHGLHQPAAGEWRLPNMPTALPPEIPWDDPADWAVVPAGPDFGRRLQGAIDSGARTVFCPPGEGERLITDTIVVRGDVARIFGLDTSYLEDAETFRADNPGPDHWPNWEGRHSDRDSEDGFAKPTFRIADGSAPAVEIRELTTAEYRSKNFWKLEVTTARPVVCDIGDIYRAPDAPPATLFLLDVGGIPVLRNCRAFIWQLNTESYDWNPHLVNEDSLVWICGHKTEKDRSTIGTYAGGWTELNGGFWYKNRQRIDMVPATLVEDASFAGSWSHYGKPYEIQCRAVQDGETATLTREEAGGDYIPLVETAHLESLRALAARWRLDLELP